MSQQDVVFSVRDLPAAITDDDLERNPSFAALLHDLCTRQSQGNPLWRPYDHELTMAKASVDRERTKLLQLELIYQEIKEIVLFQDFESNDQRFFQIIEECRERLLISEAKHHLDISPMGDGSTFVFGMSPEGFEKSLLKDLIYGTESVQQTLIPMIETRLREKYETVAEYHETSQGMNRQTHSGSFSDIASKVSQQQKEIALHERLILSMQETHFNMVVKMVKLVARSILALSEIIQSFTLTQEKAFDDTLTSYICARCDAMILKMKLLKYEVLNSTYSPVHIKALQRIKDQLDLKQEEITVEIQSANTSLAHYRGLGQSFRELAEEYATIQREIQQKIWALEQLVVSASPQRK